MNQEWEYYNHALVPATAPHIVPDTSWMKDRRKWKELADGRYPLFARWVTDFDCQEETEWWYCIKDDKLDIMSLNSKKRRMIMVGLRNVDVRIIDPFEYAEQLAEVNIAARIGYGEKLDVEKEKKALIKSFQLQKSTDGIRKIEYTGAFLKENSRLIAYGMYEVYSDWILQSVMKSDPQYHRYHANAALAYFCAEHYLCEVENIKYINIGARNILHPTNYYEYLMTYFGYRKAYCKLHIQYRMWVRVAVKILYPFRHMLKKLSDNKVIHQLTGVLIMEEIVRNSRGG